MNSNWKFLAGLGVGLVLSSLLFISWKPPEDKLTVINQARKEGMIFPEEGRLQDEKPKVELQEIELKPKMTAKEIAKLLEQEGIIQDRDAFLAQVEAKGLSGKFIAGKYKLAQAWPVDEILQLLTGKN
jgi:hypothetical protein